MSYGISVGQKNSSFEARASLSWWAEAALDGLQTGDWFALLICGKQDPRSAFFAFLSSIVGVGNRDLVN